MFWPLWILAPVTAPLSKSSWTFQHSEDQQSPQSTARCSHFMYWLEDAERVEEFIQSVWASWGTELWMKGADCFQQKLSCCSFCFAWYFMYWLECITLKGADCFQQKLAQKLLSSKSLSVPLDRDLLHQENLLLVVPFALPDIFVADVHFAYCCCFITPSSSASSFFSLVRVARASFWSIQD